jgi:hypothetical protein
MQKFFAFSIDMVTQWVIMNSPRRQTLTKGTKTMPTNHLNSSVKDMEKACSIIRRPTKTRKIYSCAGAFGRAVVLRNILTNNWTLFCYEPENREGRADDEYEYKTESEAKFYGLSFVTTGGW